jgi:S-adenosyl-L-methionine hydrolase (adenosine-forming)
MTSQKARQGARRPCTCIGRAQDFADGAVRVTPPIVFLSDFGYRNEWVGICHAVINKIAPESQVIDLSHGVPPLDVRAGALLLSDSLPYFRHEAVVLAVVDPSVGRELDIAIRTGDGRILVGPDNGLLAPAWRAAEGVANAVSITSSEILLEPVSQSFHARDVFAPAAAHLATGASLTDLGESIEPQTLVDLHVSEPTVEPGKIACEVLDLNRFGNVQLNARTSHLAAAGLDQAERISVEATSGNAVVKRVATYADLTEGEWGLMVDPRGWLSVIRGNPSNAAADLGVGADDLVWLSRGRD